MHLKTGHTGNGALWSSDFSWIIRECGNFISVQCGSICEQSSRKLHSVTGITGEADYHIFYVNHFTFHKNY